MILELKTNHDFGDWRITKEATAFRNGTKEHTCSKCGKIESTPYKLTFIQKIVWIFTHFLDIILALLGRANNVF